VLQGCERYLCRPECVGLWAISTCCLSHTAWWHGCNLGVRFLSCGIADRLVGSGSHWPIHCCIIQWGMSDWVRYTVFSTECVCFSSARVDAESA
jgi:hypothetical protein